MAAATVDMTKPVAGSSYRAFEQPGAYLRRVRVLDFEEATTAKGSALAQNDTIDVIPIDAGMLVTDVFVRELAVGTTSTTMQVGDETTATLFISSVALDGSVGAVSCASGTVSAGTIPYSGGVYYATADNIRVKLDAATAVTTGRFEFTSVMVPLSTSTTF